MGCVSSLETGPNIRRVSAITQCRETPGSDHISPSSRLAARKNSVVNVAGRYEIEFKNCPRCRPGASVERLVPIPVSPAARGAGYSTGPAPRAKREFFPFSPKLLIQADFFCFSAASLSLVAHSSQQT